MGLLSSLFSGGPSSDDTTAATPVGYTPSPQVMGAISQIESGGNPNASTGSYKGLYQLSQDEFNRYGGQGSIYDPNENTRIAQMKIADEGNQLAKALGRPVTDAEVYLAHQQGVGGATAHLQNPDQPAWQSMLSTGEGKQKGEAWAKQAIWGNVPAQYRDQFGNVNNITSGQFAQMWNDRFGRAMGQPAAPVAQAAYRAPASQPAPANAPLAAPSGTPPQLAQAPQGGGNLFAQMPADQIQMPPIQYAPRRPIDLSKLQAQLQRPPILSQG